MSNPSAEGRSSVRKGGRFAWMLGLGLGLALVAIVLLLIGSPVPKAARRPAGAGTGAAAGAEGMSGGAGAALGAVGLVRLGERGTDALLTEEARLHDPTPLFLPTDRNGSRVEARLQEPRGVFDPFPPRLVFPDGTQPVRLDSPVRVPAGPAEALDSSPAGAPFLGFGRENIAIKHFAYRGAIVGVVDMRSGRAALPAALAGALDDCLALAHPPGALPWQPLEYLAAVSASGLVGPPVLTASSGVQDVDDYFVRYLTDTARIGERLPPGVYRIDIGP